MLWPGSRSKPACQVPECEEKHAESLHEIVAGLNASVSLVAEEEDKEEEDPYVNVAWAGEWERVRERLVGSSRLMAGDGG